MVQLKMCVIKFSYDKARILFVFLCPVASLYSLLNGSTRECSNPSAPGINMRQCLQHRKKKAWNGDWSLENRWESGKLECCALWLLTTSQHSSAACHLRLMQPRGYHHLIKAPKGISFSWFHIHWHNIQEDCSNFIHASQLIRKQGCINVHMPLFQGIIWSL